ncbi:hypothetical protein CYMTET_38064 [Cymbomonas tetramitiformis]|uniref:Uncharacterized protein n=1 Tax=Cymbomonas tetramitiformis TaxID=36881 RepID=A0AAE0CE77_9CHLO|nr:hypothetical protein CYMTET_38064 [Cymbomonas tetramitiformis]
MEVETNAALKRKHESSPVESASSKRVIHGTTVPEEGEPVKTCVHEVALPAGTDAASFTPVTAQWPPIGLSEPAKEYAFKLDPFQATAANCLERRESVLVAAHTSAGKTVVAEYAIAMSIRDKQRVIYTSPLKALSNQKYRELNEEFGDVGLMTGDVTINPNASCLVMTTEVMRSMLYRGSEVMREVAWVIYDEIHYLRHLSTSTSTTVNCLPTVGWQAERALSWRREPEREAVWPEGGLSWRRDPERGVVWEESIIMSPVGTRFAFLSATIPNALEFAQWIAQLHKKPCHVVYTDYRPTPLEHYIFPTGGDGIHLVVDKKGVFRDKNFQRAVAVVSASGKAAAATKAKKDAIADKGDKGEKGAKGEEGNADIYKLVKMVVESNWHPCIVFSFSKKEVEHLCNSTTKLDLNNDDEKKLVETVYHSALDILTEDDKKLPQVVSLLPTLRRGIGMHHSGLLPILKEVIEIMFQEGLLKVLFATETFSTGLNMPAKTVIFTSCRKFDGAAFRWVSGGEYIQMSGRAGRRGLDDKGVAIMMLDERMDPQQPPRLLPAHGHATAAVFLKDGDACSGCCVIAKQMVKGKADTLYSAFHVGYNMIINLTRQEGVTTEWLIRHSFRQFQTENALPALEAKVTELEEQYAAVVIEDEPKVEEYAGHCEQLKLLNAERRAICAVPTASLPFLQPGRLVRVMCDPPGRQEGPPVVGGGERTAWGVVVNFHKVGGSEGREVEEDGEEGEGGAAKSTKGELYVVDVLAQCLVEEMPGGRAKSSPLAHGEMGGEARIIPLPLDRVDVLSSVRVHMSKDLRNADNRGAVVKALREVERRFPAGVPELDPRSDMKLKSKDLDKIRRQIESLEGCIARHPLAKSDSLQQRLDTLQAKRNLKHSIKMAKKEHKAATGMVMKDELKARNRVLKKLGYVDQEGLVQLKGQTACEISSSDEIVTTELIFSGLFKTLEVPEVVALVSCLVWTEKGVKSAKVRDELQGPLRTLHDIARRVGNVAKECKMEVEVEEFVEMFSPDLMEIAYAWSRGARFAEVMKMAEIFEGSLVRAMRRLEELLRQISAAAKSIGDDDLMAKMDQAGESVKRDIVFAASLYL